MIRTTEPCGPGLRSLELFGRIQGDSGRLKVIKTKKRKNRGISNVKSWILLQKPVALLFAKNGPKNPTFSHLFAPNPTFSRYFETFLFYGKSSLRRSKQPKDQECD
ncbi:MAG: hypothetical protein ABSA83_15810 [Verrucomicrobiota bacterium]|jgi:hypothetical protein